MNVEIIIYSVASFYGNEEIGNLVNEMFKNHNILIFKGSGNDGPFYTSVRKIDSNVMDSIFNIGALLTSEMQKKIYYATISEEANSHPPIVYNFSSRGPGENGSRGLDFVAPGAAISYAPRFAFEEKKCFVGTSCSSPNAAGAVACLLSGLKAKSIEYSPALIKFALFKTAFLPKNVNIFEFGHGIIQINEAFEYFCKKINDLNSVPNQLNGSYGASFTLLNGQDQNVTERDFNLSDFINGNKDAKKWIIQVSKNAENFISVSEINEKNLFTVKVDTNKLEAGNFYFGEIIILHPKIGSILNIPVFICYPIKVTETKNLHIQKEITLTSESPFRFVIYPFFKSSKVPCEIAVIALQKLRTNICIQNVEYNNRFQSIVDRDPKKILKFSTKNQIETYSFTLEKPEIQEICIFSTVATSLKSNAKLRIELSFKN
uniref:Peptidase S8/S53 domain-containing protein n=1 Tax=Panagrolaimus sp. PS1159 TaxID=55785 RepID=A0AC35FH37_9BILA